MGAFSLGGSVDTGRLFSFGGLRVSNPASLVRRFVQVFKARPHDERRPVLRSIPNFVQTVHKDHGKNLPSQKRQLARTPPAVSCSLIQF